MILLVLIVVYKAGNERVLSRIPFFIQEQIGMALHINPTCLKAKVTIFEGVSAKKL